MPAEGARRPTTVDVVLPVLNERRVLETSVRRLRRHLETLREFDARIVIADNGSTDGTLDVANRLVQTMPGVSVTHLNVRGRGRALRRAWTDSTADVVAYMDIDLSTDLAALQPLLELVASGRADVATGSRLAPGASVTRGVRREVISRAYNALLRESLDMPVRDAQWGFKAVRASVARALLPFIEDEGGSSTPSCWHARSARATGLPSYRCDGSRTATRVCVWSEQHWPICVACDGSAAPASTGRDWEPGAPARSADPVLPGPARLSARHGAGDLEELIGGVLQAPCGDLFGGDRHAEHPLTAVAKNCEGTRLVDQADTLLNMSTVSAGHKWMPHDYRHRTPTVAHGVMDVTRRLQPRHASFNCVRIP